MCIGGQAPAPTVIDSGQRQSAAAADAVVARRKGAQGFAATLGSGMPASQPSIGRQLMLGS